MLAALAPQRALLDAAKGRRRIRSKTLGETDHSCLYRSRGVYSPQADQPDAYLFHAFPQFLRQVCPGCLLWP